MNRSEWCKSDRLGSTYNAAGAAPGLPLLPKRPAKNCCTILERAETESEEVRLKTKTLLFVLTDKSAAFSGRKKGSIVCSIVCFAPLHKKKINTKKGFDLGIAEREASPAVKKVHFGK